MVHRLPNPGSDDGVWGDILNDFLLQSLNSDGSLKSVDPTKVTGTALTVGSSTANQVPVSSGSGAYTWQTLGGRGSSFTVAASNTAAALQKGADYICTGANDDVIINQALSAMQFNGGVVRLLPGDFYLGTTSTSFINGINQNGGMTLQGSGRRQASLIHVPAGSAAPCAIRMAVWGGGSNIVRDLHVVFDGTPSGTTAGIWMQCNEAQVKDCIVSKSAGHGIIIDGAPSTLGTSVTAPSVATFSGHVDGCEVLSAGSGVNAPGGTGATGDGFLVTALSQNCVLTSCFVDGGTGTAAGMVTSALTSGTAYTSLTCTPLTGALTSGEQIVLGSVGTWPTTYQLLTTTASASKGATTVSVSNFTASANYSGSNNQTYIASTTKMVTRNGFTILATAHVDDAHPYFCHESGLTAHQNAVFINGGEYETNGWANIHVNGSLTSEGAPGNPIAPLQIIGANMYGNPACANIYNFAMTPGIFSNNYIDAGNSVFGIYVQSATGAIISNNTILNAVTGYQGQSAAISVTNSAYTLVSANTVSNNLTFTGSHYYGISVFNTTNSLVVDNIVNTTGTNISISSSTGSIGRSNIGYNPLGVQTVAVPATTVAVAAANFDRVFYITTGTGTTTVAISGGPTITLTASALNTVRLPAGATLTPTYTNAPTWVVEGE